ncbi:hypothetical protein ANCDUO_01628, partial [Ancylostoma duodenale]
DEFIKLGGKITENEEVRSYKEISDDVVELQTSKTLLHSKKAIFTVGAWIRKVFPKAPLNIQCSNNKEDSRIGNSYRIEKKEVR